MAPALLGGSIGVLDTVSSVSPLLWTVLYRPALHNEDIHQYRLRKETLPFLFKNKLGPCSLDWAYIQTSGGKFKTCRVTLVRTEKQKLYVACLAEKN